jgi:hypothetical protein
MRVNKLAGEEVTEPKRACKAKNDMAGIDAHSWPAEESVR